MCNRLALVLVVVSLAPFASFGPGVCANHASAAIGAVAAPLQQNVPNNNEDLCRSFRGKVVQLMEKTVTIKPEGNLKIVGYRTVDGVKVTRTYIQDNTKRPRTFTFTDELLYDSGLNPGYRGGGCPYFDHLVTDLKAGDSVYISFYPSQGKDCCDRIKIESRPDGNVPPTVFEKREMEREVKEKR